MTGLDWRRAKKQRTEPPRPRRKTRQRREAKRPAVHHVNPTPAQVAWLMDLRSQTPYLDDDVAVKIRMRAQDARARGQPLTPLAKVLIETQLRQSAAAKAKAGSLVGLAWRHQASCGAPASADRLKAAREKRAAEDFAMEVTRDLLA